MKNKVFLLCLAASVLLFIASCGTTAPDPPAGIHESEADEGDCPPEGNAKSAHVRDLNRLKNRSSLPLVADFDPALSLQALLEPGDDISRWSDARAGRVKGYVYDVKVGGDETCNCKATDKARRDTHIELVLDPMDAAKTRRVVVEVTPRMRNKMKQLGQDWSTAHLREALLGRWVEVEGWLLFDEEHRQEAENTNPGRDRNWRATAWEIHPVTKMTLISRPRSSE